VIVLRPVNGGDVVPAHLGRCSVDSVIGDSTTTVDEAGQSQAKSSAISMYTTSGGSTTSVEQGGKVAETTTLDFDLMSTSRARQPFPFPVRIDCAHPKWGTWVGNVSTSRGSDEDWAVFSQVSTAAAASTDPWLEILSRSTPGGVIFAMLCSVERLIDVTGDRVMS